MFQAMGYFMGKIWGNAKGVRRLGKLLSKPRTEKPSEEDGQHSTEIYRGVVNMNRDARRTSENTTFSAQNFAKSLQKYALKCLAPQKDVAWNTHTPLAGRCCSQTKRLSNMK